MPSPVRSFGTKRVHSKARSVASTTPGPAICDSDKASEGGHVDQRFNPLHARKSLTIVLVPQYLGALTGVLHMMLLSAIAVMRIGSASATDHAVMAGFLSVSVGGADGEAEAE
jgi:hypothetical protein